MPCVARELITGCVDSAWRGGVGMNDDNESADNVRTVRTVRLSEEGRRFAQRCAVLTGFKLFDLLATGVADLYFATARDQVGAAVVDAVLAAVDRDPAALSGTDLEVARALTYLWYTGAWPRLAPEAHGLLRREMANIEFVVSPDAYTEGLVWRTFDGHPGGAKAPGFGTWAFKPPSPFCPKPPESVAAPGRLLKWSEFPSALPPSTVVPRYGSAAPRSTENTSSSDCEGSR